MSYRRKNNSHEIWQQWLTASAELLQAIPRAVLASEKVFRAFATSGVHESDAGTLRLADLDDAQVTALWEFANLRTEFDMDATRFDALNVEHRARAASAR